MREIDFTPETTENTPLNEAAETAQEMVETTPETTEAAKTAEVGENVSETAEGAETVGYSSEYYKHRMAEAIANGNRNAYEIAKKNYGEALAKEKTKPFEK